MGLILNGLAFWSYPKRLFFFQQYLSSARKEKWNTVGIWKANICIAETSEQWTFTCMLFRSPIIVWSSDVRLCLLLKQSSELPTILSTIWNTICEYVLSSLVLCVVKNLIVWPMTPNQSWSIPNWTDPISFHKSPHSRVPIWHNQLLNVTKGSIYLYE